MRFLLLVFAWGFALAALAQAFPSKPIRLVVGYPPGGSGDFTTRIAGDELARELGVAVVVENKPGAGGNIANEMVARSPADGYTILNAWHFAINKALYKSTSYEEKDFAAVSRVAIGPTVICVRGDSPLASLKDLIAYAKSNPGKLFNASAGYGSTPHLASVLFESVAGVSFTSIQFKGGGPAAQSLLAGDTQVMFATSPTVMGFVRAGRMRALSTSMRQRSPSVPDVPGAEEAGLPGYDFTFWFGLFVPAGTPPAVVRRLHEAAAKGLSRPEVREKIAVQGMDAAPSASPEAFEAELRAEAPILQKVIRESGAKVE
ncbi:MAG TPA: tripartite tricarboxylate transporter substrate binding protein [Burkholderiales bacterium]